jgi:hypothetical protein
VLKAWIDQGAQWPDHLSGIPPTLPVDPASEQLAGLISSGERARTDELLRTNPGAARARTSGGSTPLMAAALYGDATLMQQLLAIGADANATNVAGATALMWALPDTAKMRALLDAGADVDARTEDRRTALVIASGIVGADAAVQLLLERGAKASPAAASDPSALREAVRVGNAGVFTLLRARGADASAIPADPSLELLGLCAGTRCWRRRTSGAHAAARSRSPPHPAGAICAAAPGRRDHRYSGCGSSRGGTKPAVAADDRAALHPEDRLRVVSSQ